MTEDWKTKADATVKLTLATFAPGQSAYVVALQNDLDGLAFLASQVQFGFAVRAFSRPLAILVSRCETVEHRAVLVENLWEEHGEGDLSKSHAATFELFLDRLAAAVHADLASTTTTAKPAANVFNRELARWAEALPVGEAAAALGMVERLFADYSNEIAQGVIRRKFLAKDALAHYALHEERDLHHADDLFSLARGLDLARFTASIQRGAETFSTFYDALLAEGLAAPARAVTAMPRTSS